MSIFRIGGVVVCVAACSESANVTHFQFVIATDSIEIFDAYAPAPAAPDVGSLYFTIINTGSHADTLIGIETSIAEDATLHAMRDEAGSMVMYPTGPVAIAPRDTLRLAPGGFHVMVTGMPTRPQVGDTITVTLTFARTSRIDFPVPILTYTDVVQRLEMTGDHEP